MKRAKPLPKSEWQEHYDAFKKMLPTISNAHSPSDIFRDVCRIFSLSLRGAVTMDRAERDGIESTYASLVGKYGQGGMEKVGTMFAHLVEALELKRSDFLGHVYEDLNATVKSFGQFFTPDCVSRMMARMTFSACPEPGRVVTMNDCACGAGALLIEGAEAFVECGGRQGDMLIYAEDPLRTITTRNNLSGVFAVLDDGRLLDVRIRMLKPSELAAAHSFPKDYKLSGSRADQVKQIGNSVPVRTAKAIVKAIFGKAA